MGSQCVSVFLIIMKNKFDDLLMWPFCCEVTVMFLNTVDWQHYTNSGASDPSVITIQRPPHDMKISSCNPCGVIKHNDLENRRFITSDDSFYIKIMVNTTGYDLIQKDTLKNED